MDSDPKWAFQTIGPTLFELKSLWVRDFGEKQSGGLEILEIVWIEKFVGIVWIEKFISWKVCFAGVGKKWKKEWRNGGSVLKKKWRIKR